MSDENSVQLPFERDRQAAALGHLIQDDKFFSHTLGRITPEWFSDAYCQKILKGKLDFYEKYKRPPTPEELLALPEFVKEDAKTRIRLTEVFNDCLQQTQKYGLDAITVELTGWWHAIVYQQGIRKSSMLYNNKKNGEAYQALSETVHDLKYTTFDQDREETFDNYLDDFEQAQIEYNDALSFGLTIFDQLLAPKATSGCLLKGDMSLIIAASNAGKTKSLITTIAYNIKRGKKCLWAIHEGRVADLKESMRCAMLNCTATQLYANYLRPEYQQTIQEANFLLKNYLTFLPLSKPGLTVEEVDAIIRKKHDEAIAKTGKGYELIVDDYPAKLTTSKNRGNMPKRLEDEVIYNYFRTMAENLNVHVLTAIQANREGSKVNKGLKEVRLLTKEDVQESWGAITAATNVWTINRSDMAAAANILTYYIDKSRSSETGWAITCHTDYGRCITHSDELGATYFRNSGDYEQKMSQYLDQDKMKEKPLELGVTNG